MVYSRGVLYQHRAVNWGFSVAQQTPHNRLPPELSISWIWFSMVPGTHQALWGLTQLTVLRQDWCEGSVSNLDSTMTLKSERKLFGVAEKGTYDLSPTLTFSLLCAIHSRHSDLAWFISARFHAFFLPSIYLLAFLYNIWKQLLILQDPGLL